MINVMTIVLNIIILIIVTVQCNYDINNGISCCSYTPVMDFVTSVLA